MMLGGHAELETVGWLGLGRTDKKVVLGRSSPGPGKWSNGEKVIARKSRRLEEEET